MPPGAKRACKRRMNLSAKVRFVGPTAAVFHSSDSKSSIETNVGSPPIVRRTSPRTRSASICSPSASRTYWEFTLACAAAFGYYGFRLFERVLDRWRREDFRHIVSMLPQLPTISAVGDGSFTVIAHFFI